MKTVLNGPTMWPADGNHLVGPAPEWDTAPNFWLACAERGSQASLAPLRCGRYHAVGPRDLAQPGPTVLHTVLA